VPTVHLDEAVALLLIALAALTSWGLVDRRSAAARRLRAAWCRPGLPVPVVLMVVGFASFAVIAEDVLERDPGELVFRLDRQARASARMVQATPGVLPAAEAVSHLTGKGLGVLVTLAAGALFVSGRRRDALVLLLGTLGAWGLSGLLKLAFAVPRPYSSETTYAITRYGFPGGHAVVATAACGLVAWLAGRRAPVGVRVFLWTGVGGLVVLTAAARVILKAHWLSDVVGGMGIGAAWLGLVMLAASPAGTARAVAPP